MCIELWWWKWNAWLALPYLVPSFGYDREIINITINLLIPATPQHRYAVWQGVKIQCNTHTCLTCLGNTTGLPVPVSNLHSPSVIGSVLLLHFASLGWHVCHITNSHVCKCTMPHMIICIHIHTPMICKDLSHFIFSDFVYYYLLSRFYPLTAGCT